MKKLFNARSPFWQLILYGTFFYAAILIAKRHETKDAELLQLNYSLSFAAGVLLIVIGIAYAVQIIRYNKIHKNTPIRYFGLFPPELKEEDEGMRMFTARATRRVYIFHATFLPILAIIYVYILPSAVYAIAGLAFLVIGHFAIYLTSIWPVLEEGE